MDALLLALLLGLALDQGDRSQSLARSLGPGALVPVCFIILVGALIPALLGVAVASYLRGPAGLLFFAIALALGAAGLLMPGGKGAKLDEQTGGRVSQCLQLLGHRLTNGTSFLLVGVTAMTGNPWATALGGTLGGLGALLPPLLAGPAYERAMPLRIIRPILGAVLLLAGLACGLSALGLL